MQLRTKQRILVRRNIGSLHPFPASVERQSEQRSPALRNHDWPAHPSATHARPDFPPRSAITLPSAACPRLWATPATPSHAFHADETAGATRYLENAAASRLTSCIRLRKVRRVFQGSRAKGPRDLDDRIRERMRNHPATGDTELQATPNFKRQRTSSDNGPQPSAMTAKQA